MSTLDEDALIAAVDLTRRAGAQHFQIGWDCPHSPDTDDNHACPDVRWYAHAQYRGTRIIEPDHNDPTEAAEALGRRLLTGARCRCGKVVALSDEGATVFDNVRMADGTRWTAAQAARAGRCRWTRMGKRWEPGCNAPPIKLKSRW